MVLADDAYSNHRQQNKNDAEYDCGLIKRLFQTAPGAIDSCITAKDATRAAALSLKNDERCQGKA